ncbi:MAG: hypothetical protein HGA96_14530 [Desulfobulbaceae bacterium]|nr:hypothetical protein [Desulfobulbaceae bacterium]
MAFTSFEEALHICMTATEGSPEQEAALAHCLETAPPDLRLMLAKRLGGQEGHGHHDHGCGCGCSGSGE